MFSFGFFGIQHTLSATKCHDGQSGLVRVRGWSGQVTSGHAVAFTILDEDSQQGWTRLIDAAGMSSGAQSQVEPLEVKIHGLSIGHRIKVTVKVLKSRLSGVVGGVEHLEVASEGSCAATEESVGAVGGNSLSHLMTGMLMPSAVSGRSLAALEVSIEQITTFSKASVTIKLLHMYPTHWVISVRPASPSPFHQCSIEHVFILQRQGFGCQQSFEFPISFKASRKYQVIVQSLNAFNPLSSFVEKAEFSLIGSGTVEFRAELTKTDLSALHAKAIEHVRYHGNASCISLYRNKPQPYFDDIFQNHRGIMEVYAKDNSGDPGSPINDRIKGLFFMATVEPGSTTGEPARVSAFGGTRLVIPAETLLGRASKLYFADFYCMRGQFHYVTLVMTRPGSEADLFCTQRLLLLSVHDRSGNPFLFYDGGSLQVSTRDHLNVELLFTENLDINQYRNELRCNTPLIGKGQSTPGGIPKKANCTICNLVPGFRGLFVTDEF